MSEGEGLPKGWTWTTLGEVRIDKSPGISPARHPEQIFELYSVPSFEARVPEIVQGRAVGSNKQIVEPGTVLICKINPHINRVWIVGNHSPNVKIASTEWIPFSAKEGVNSGYLCYFLRRDQLRDFLAANASGVGGSLMRVKPRTLEHIAFPVAPRPEQDRIVAKLDELFSKLDAGVAALERARAGLKRYRAAVLKAAVEGRLTEEWRAKHPDAEPASVLLRRILDERRRRWEADQLAKFAASGKQPPKGWQAKYQEPAGPDTSKLPELPKGWAWATAAQIGEIQGGIQKQPQRRPDKNRYPFLRVANVLRGRLDLREVHEIELFHGELERLRLKTGDLLVVEGNGSPTEIGRSAIWLGEIINCVHQNHIIRVRPLKLRPEYLNSYWNSPAGTRRIMEVAASTSGLYTLSVSKVSALPIPVPPFQEQKQIVDEVENQLSVVDHLKNEIDTNLNRSARLRQAILKRAFEGRLVPQDAASGTPQPCRPFSA